MQGEGQNGGSGAVYDPSRRLRHIAGRMLLFDDEGFLWRSEDWDEELALALAAESGLTELSEVQWQVLRFQRQFYAESGRAPLNRQLAAGTGLPLLQVEGLFPGGIKKGARRIAGLPNPKNCA